MKNNLIPIFLGAVSVFLSTACKENYELEEPRTITVTASFSEDGTRAIIDQASGSLDLITRWKEDDKIRIYLFQDGNGFTLEPVKVYSISDDGKRCSFGFQLPSAISIDHPYEVYGLCDAEGTLVNEDGYVLAKSQLKRMQWSDRIVPMWFHATGGQSSIQANFRHLGTYEILHVTNTSKVGVMFRHDGFDVEVPWYKSFENTPLKDDYDPTQHVQEPGDDAHSGSAFIPANSTGKYLSWYIPTGATINDARLLATIEGKSVSSVNTKSSSVRFQRGHVYHMYATWDGNELKFDKANELLDELGIGFTHLDMQENGAYGFVTGREGHLRLESTDPSVATAIETDDIGELHIDILSHSIGTAIITITDTNTGQKSQIEVVVTESTSFDLGLRVGETDFVVMKNEDGQFEAYSDDASIATCEVKGNKVFVTAHKLGETSIRVMERNTDKQYVIYVIVFADGVQDIVPEPIDMGLPSGTKWAPYNVGSTKSHEAGLRFAWGEIYPKSNYDWNTYKFAIDMNGTCYDIGDDISGTEYDVARQRWGQNWSMPTVEQVRELFMNSSIVWKPQEGVKGVEVTSRINGNTIFIPVSGVFYENETYATDRYCYYWTSYLDDVNKRLAIDFVSQNSGGAQDAIWKTEMEERCIGLPVRPVYMGAGVATPEIVDLGLSVKWRAFNLGASKPEECGDYYAWGETMPKTVFDESNYSYYSTSERRYTKYVMSNGSPYQDNVALLFDEDDAAKTTLGGKWRMPTLHEFVELLNPDNCQVEEYELNSIKGYRIVSRKNGNSIFLPFLDKLYGPDWVDSDHELFLWSSNLDFGGENLAHTIYVTDYDFYTTSQPRESGYPIRPVYGDPSPKSTHRIFLDRQELHLWVGDSATVSLYNAINNDVNWTCDDSNIAIVSLSGTSKVTVSSLQEGSTTISATKNNGEIVTCKLVVTSKPTVVIPDIIDLGLSVKWASFNLGATNPYEPGNKYAWGEVEPKSLFSWEDYSLCMGTYDTLLHYCGDDEHGFNGFTDSGYHGLYPEDDAAYYALGGRWRTPTIEEFEELHRNTSASFNDEWNGMVLTSKINGNSIVLPLKCRDYWSSSFEFYPYGYWIADYVTWRGTNYYYRDELLGIRPVYDDE